MVNLAVHLDNPKWDLDPPRLRTMPVKLLHVLEPHKRGMLVCFPSPIFHWMRLFWDFYPNWALSPNICINMRIIRTVTHTYAYICIERETLRCSYVWLYIYMFDTAWTDTYTLHIHCNNLPTHTRIQSIFILYAYIYTHRYSINSCFAQFRCPATHLQCNRCASWSVPGSPVAKVVTIEAQCGVKKYKTIFKIQKLRLVWQRTPGSPPKWERIISMYLIYPLVN